MRFLMLLLFVTACVLAPVTAEADFIDDFESYTLGDIDGQGPWIDFGGVNTTDVVNTLAYSGEQSMAQTLSGTELNGYGSDTYVVDLDGAPLTSGKWQLSYQLLIPQNFNGVEYMWISQGPMPTTFTAGMDLIADNVGNAAVFGDEASGDWTPLVFDRWAEVVAEIDLDADTVTVSYDGNVFHTGAWDVDATGTPAIGGMNVWVSADDDDTIVYAGTAYIDDLSIVAVPEPGTVTLLLMGLAAIATACRRRK